MMHDCHKVESYGLSFICLLPLYIFLISAPSTLTLNPYFSFNFLPFVLFLSLYSSSIFFSSFNLQLTLIPLLSCFLVSFHISLILNFVYTAISFNSF
jgi:hypothetical protein